MKLDIRPELETIANALKTLKNDGVIRSKNLVGDLGEYYCKILFNLTLEPDKVNKGFDAKDIKEKRVEIKTRRTPEDKSKIIFKGFDFKYCYFVVLNDFFQPETIYKIKSSMIKKVVDKKGDRLSVKKLISKTKAEIVFPFVDNKQIVKK